MKCNDMENQMKQVVLTFDDGPDPKYTPILDILKENQIKAFVLGENAQPILVL